VIFMGNRRAEQARFASAKDYTPKHLAKKILTSRAREVRAPAQAARRIPSRISPKRDCRGRMRRKRAAAARHIPSRISPPQARSRCRSGTSSMRQGRPRVA
jgi:hypothetical protein